MRRDLRAHQGVSVEITTENISSIPISEVSEKGLEFDVHNQQIDKTLWDNKQSPNLHSPPQVNLVLESSLNSDDFIPTISGSFNHKTRSTNLTDFEKSQPQRINFPRSSDKATWSEINEELRLALPQVFTKTYINTTCITELSKKFDEWLYSFFIERFGVVENPSDVANESTPCKESRNQKKFRHRGLERLRRRKNLLRKEYKKLLKLNLGNSTAGIILKNKWKETLRKHNRLRLAVNKLRSAKLAAAAQKSFKKDHHGFASKIFTNSKNAAPTFSKETATKYFSETYRDEERGDHFDPLPDLERPPRPTFIFNEECPTFRELSKSVQKKSNRAAAGINGLSYVPYKKCPAILGTLLKIVKKIWTSQEIPEDWAQAFVVLLSKSDILDDPAEFRPIAITNTVGKIFFSVISDRLQTFLVKNEFIRTATQKGFLSGVPGCLEHAFTLYEALRNAKESRKQIVVAWIDLANAYGSVRHNLIQFALNWYHVPHSIQKLIFDYYEKLMAKVQTSEWSTGFFLFDIGLFQGCVLSTILFDVVFQLLLDLLQPLNEDLGYKIKNISYTKLTRAYADDLAFSAKTTDGLQKACDVAGKFLSWTKTMKAKPRKCIAVGFRQFDKRTDSGRFVPHFNLTYAPFDPKVTISGHRMKFLVDESKPVDPSVSLLRDHFKFLGRWISIDLNEFKVNHFLKTRFMEEVNLVEKTRLTGFMKLWLYQHYLLAHLAWPFLIQDLTMSFAKELESSISMTLKRWAGLYRGADTGSLFRSRANCGLGLTSVSHFFCKMQLIKCSLLEKSNDPTVNDVYDLKSKKTSRWKVKWSVNRIFKAISADVLLQTKFPSQSGRLGLGHGLFTGQPTNAEIRHLVTQTADNIKQQELLSHSVQLSRQGTWINFSESTVPFDLSWKNLIFGPSHRVISFVINATINSCKTPSMMKLWGYKKSDKCTLCDETNCTLHHILSNCKVSLQQQRYTWRHDSVLLVLQLSISEYLEKQTKQPQKSVKLIKFVKKGSACGKGNSRSSYRSSSILDNATDWKILVDFTKKKILFPPEIYATSERPDIVLFSHSSHKVILIELTCPAEEGIEAASLRKKGRYNQLLADINDDVDNPWSASLFTIEGGARGFVAYSMLSFLRKIGIAPRKARSICKQVSCILVRCSYAIWLQREAHNWDSNRELIELNSPLGAE